jgi:hypothetical protein
MCLRGSACIGDERDLQENIQGGGDHRRGDPGKMSHSIHSSEHAFYPGRESLTECVTAQQDDVARVPSDAGDMGVLDVVDGVARPCVLCQGPGVCGRGTGQQSVKLQASFSRVEGWLSPCIGRW